MKQTALVFVLFSLLASLATAQPAAPAADPAAPPAAAAPTSTPTGQAMEPAAAPAVAPAPPPAEQPAVIEHARPRKKLVGVGYKAGNGIGFLGADVIVDPIPHVGVDLQVAMMPVSSNGESGNIYAIAPSVHGYLFANGRSTPYVAVGMVGASLTLGSASATVVGTFANIGYEWRWRFGLGLQVGGGVGYISKGEAHDGANMVTFGGQWNPNLEIGLRYFLF